MNLREPFAFQPAPLQCRMPRNTSMRRKPPRRTRPLHMKKAELVTGNPEFKLLGKEISLHWLK